MHGKEIKGIAHVDQQGKFRLSVRDQKAKNTNDAARRLTYVTIRAHEQLTGDANASSKDVIVPILSIWRCYTGNTRLALANDKGIHRNEGLLGLDTPAKEEADRFMKEMLDDKIEGAWKPAASSGKSKKAATKSAK